MCAWHLEKIPSSLDPKTSAQARVNWEMAKDQRSRVRTGTEELRSGVGQGTFGCKK